MAIGRALELTTEDPQWFVVNWDDLIMMIIPSLDNDNAQDTTKLQRPTGSPVT